MLRALVIDDDDSVRHALGFLLNASGYLCTLERGAAEGIRRAEEGIFDIALVDINMPGMSGLEAVKALARISPRISIIAMSGLRYAGDLDYAMLAPRSGADCFLAKPFDRNGLLRAIAVSVEGEVAIAC